MGTQTRIAEQIIEQNGDYALALKDNHGNLFDEVKATFALAEKDGFASPFWESDRQVETGHGRLEIREQWTLSDQDILAYLVEFVASGTLFPCWHSCQASQSRVGQPVFFARSGWG
jgi:hypothetical protein